MTMEEGEEEDGYLVHFNYQKEVHSFIMQFYY